MDYLVARPEMTFAGAGNGTSFAAEIFNGRPPFEQIHKLQAVMNEIALEVQSSMERPSCRIASVDLIVDGEGLLGIFVFQQPLNTGNAKRAIDTLLRALPAEQQRAVQECLRPFDYLDFLRVEDMLTVAELRPLDEEEEPEEEYQDLPFCM